MYIRRTTIKSRKSGEPYYTHRLVESVRTGKGVKQRTILNLGKDFPYPKKLWPDLACRIEEVISGQMELFQLPAEIEKAAQHYAALIIQARKRAADTGDNATGGRDYQDIDVNSLELMRPRSVGGEHVAYHSLRQLQLDSKLKELGFNKHAIGAAIGTIIGRMLEPGSELATHFWLQNHSALGELIDYDYESMSLTRMYAVTDILLKHKEQLERHLYQQQRLLFEFEETITLFDLTNTYFEGSCKFNELGAHGKSKEKRTDCPLVTLGLVLDGSGFPKRSEVFSGNVFEAHTLQEMIKGLTAGLSAEATEDEQQALFQPGKPTIVLDAGIASEENINWLKTKGYRYLVVSRKRHREFSEDKAVEVKKDRECTVKAYKKNNDETGEVELYCHSTRREDKERAILDRFTSRFEEALKAIDEGLSKKGCTKKYDKVIERIGRLKEKYSKAAKNYKITVKKDKKTDKAVKIIWGKKQNTDSPDSYPGVYCLRTNWDTLDESTLWRTYTMLTDLEAVFRSLKSELGLRPVFHQKTRRVSGHLFITLLAYHLVHTIRYQIKEKGICLSWSGIRKQLRGQDRITARMENKDGQIVHVRKSTRPEPRQQVIYDALGISYYPGRTVKEIV